MESGSGEPDEKATRKSLTGRDSMTADLDNIADDLPPTEDQYAHVNHHTKMGGGHVVAFSTSRWRKKVSVKDRASMVFGDFPAVNTTLPKPDACMRPVCKKVLVQRIAVKHLFNVGKPPRVFIFDFEHDGVSWRVQRLALDILKCFRDVHHDLHKINAHKKLPKLPWMKLVNSRRYGCLLLIKFTKGCRHSNFKGFQN